MKHKSLCALRNDWERILHLCNSRERFTKIRAIGDSLALHRGPPVRRAAHYWKLVRQVWIDADMAYQCDGGTLQGSVWYRNVADDRTMEATRDLVMTRSERRTLAALPPVVAVYRGCIRGLNERGWSWTLKRHVADDFALLANSPRMKSYGGVSGVPIVVMCRVSRAKILSYFGEREEEEVVIDPRTLGKVREIAYAQDKAEQRRAETQNADSLTLRRLAVRRGL